MRIETSLNMSNVSPMVNVIHLGQTLSFSISFYRRTMFTGEYDVFNQINSYWEDQTPERQQAIFDTYRRIFDSFGEIYMEMSIKEYLQKQVAELLSYHKPEHIQEWIAFRSTDIQVPTSIPTEFVQDIDRNTSPNKTYVASEYRQLTALAMILRTMIPVWGEYIASIKSETDTAFLALQAFQLVDKVLTPEVPAVRKLIEYIDSKLVPAAVEKSTAVFKGIPSADHARWMLALICTRCISVADIRGNNPEAHLATFIHIFIKNRVSEKDDSGDSKIKDKKIDETMTDDGARASALERYKVKANVSIGDLVELEHFLNDHVRIAQLLSPGVDMTDVNTCLEQIKEYEGAPTAPQITLLRWFLSPIASHSGILYMPEQLLKRLMAIAEATLWHRGHRYLGVLMSCHPIRSEKEIVVSPVDSKMRIPGTLLESLDAGCEYKLNPKSKRTVVATGKEVNVSTISIDLLTNHFMTFGWRPTTSTERVEAVLGIRTLRYPIKPDIKTDLARLLVEVNQPRHLV